MKYLIAIDSFKGSMTSDEAAQGARAGILRAQPDAEVEISALADGGEGTVEALKDAFGASERWVDTVDPLGRKIKAKYYATDRLAIMEMSACAGITLLSEEELNPMHTTTYGVGLMIRDAIDKGCREFIIGVGGSATNDGGMGMLQALGYRLLDDSKNQVPYGAYGGGCIEKILIKYALPELKGCMFKVLCDVTNPMLGKNGSTYVYARQKGGRGEALNIMENCLEHFAKISKKVNPEADPYAPGCGAAGGIAFAFLTYLNATLVRGIDAVMEATGLEEKIKNADVIITGEGKMDGQSASGKAPVGVAKLAKKHSKRVVALCGATGKGYEKCLKEGIDEIYVISDPEKTLVANMKTSNAIDNIEKKAYEIFSK